MNQDYLILAFLHFSRYQINQVLDHALVSDSLSLRINDPYGVLRDLHLYASEVNVALVTRPVELSLSLEYSDPLLLHLMNTLVNEAHLVKCQEFLFLLAVLLNSRPLH